MVNIFQMTAEYRIRLSVVFFQFLYYAIIYINGKMMLNVDCFISTTKFMSIFEMNVKISIEYYICTLNIVLLYYIELI